MEKKQFHKKNYIYAGILILGLVTLDQWTKILAVSHLKNQTPIVLIKHVFQLQYLENRGAAFGLLQNQRIFFLIISIVILSAIVFIYFRLPAEKIFLPLRFCAIFISAGAIGNMIDRIRLGYVIDFLYFKLIDFPIFNVADIYVTVSTILLVILVMFYYKEDDLEKIFSRRK